MKYKYILFDLDGTLTDPFEGITKSFRYALNAFGIDADCKDLTSVIGPPLIYSFCNYYGFDKEKGEMAVEKYRERFSDIGWQENRLLDGVPEMLKAVRATGATIALATAKPHVFAEKIINKFDIARYFDVAVGAELDGSINTKSQVIAKTLEMLGNPPLDKIIMIGDRSDDVLGARENGIDCVGVRFGYAAEGELERAGAAYIVDTVKELEKFLCGQ